VSSDSEIIERSRDNPGLFAELYDRHARTIFRFAIRQVGTGAAEDVMSETFLVAFERRAAFDPTVGAALPWLYGIATTLLKKYVRSEATARRGILAAGKADVVTDDIAVLESRVDAESSVRQIDVALRRMAKRDRDVLLLHAWADLSYEDIARALEIPIGTVRSRLNRARRVLRTAIDRGASPQKGVDHGRVDAAAQRS
jgi:RNA polymerase sigma factor (sigma-70 family)